MSQPTKIGDKTARKTITLKVTARKWGLLKTTIKEGKYLGKQKPSKTTSRGKIRPCVFENGVLEKNNKKHIEFPGKTTFEKTGRFIPGT